MTFGVIKKVMATSYDPVTFWGHKLGQTDHKGHRDRWVIKSVTATSNDPATFWVYKLSQTDHKGHRDLWDHKVGDGDIQ